MTPYQRAAFVFNLACAVHDTACAASRAGRRAGAPADVRRANKARLWASHDAVQAAYCALTATPR
jgi:hypothetical protein